MSSLVGMLKRVSSLSAGALRRRDRVAAHLGGALGALRGRNRQHASAHGENAPIAVLVPAPPAVDSQFHRCGRTLDRKIQPAAIGAIVGAAILILIFGGLRTWA